MTAAFRVYCESLIMLGHDVDKTIENGQKLVDEEVLTQRLREVLSLIWHVGLLLYDQIFFSCRKSVIQLLTIHKHYEKF